jgi:hypothetical protein
MSNESVPAMLATLKRSAGALREAGIPFMLGGGLACWVRGGPESDHDLDLMVKPEDAEQALATLTAIGMRPEKPSEGWLYKAFDEDVMVDIIFSRSASRSRTRCSPAPRCSRSRHSPCLS